MATILLEPKFLNECRLTRSRSIKLFLLPLSRGRSRSIPLIKRGRIAEDWAGGATAHVTKARDDRLIHAVMEDSLGGRQTFAK